MATRPLGLALLISGGGTTAAEVLKAMDSGKLKGLVEPRLVIASKHCSAGIDKALAAGMDTDDVGVISPGAYPDPLQFGARILEECARREVAHIGQYGWLPLTPANVVAYYKGRMTNQHPGPLNPGGLCGDFGGKGMYGARVTAARMYFCKEVKRDYWTEATGQKVGLTLDSGKVLKTQRVYFEPSDTVEQVRGKLLPVEHEVQIDLLGEIAQGISRIIERPGPWLVRPGEEEILARCKAQAIADYPNG